MLSHVKYGEYKKTKPIINIKNYPGLKLGNYGKPVNRACLSLFSKISKCLKFLTKVSIYNVSIRLNLTLNSCLSG